MTPTHRHLPFLTLSPVILAHSDTVLPGSFVLVYPVMLRISAQFEFARPDCTAQRPSIARVSLPLGAQSSNALWRMSSQGEVFISERCLTTNFVPLPAVRRLSHCRLVQSLSHCRLVQSLSHCWLVQSLSHCWLVQSLSHCRLVQSLSHCRLVQSLSHCRLVQSLSHCRLVENLFHRRLVGKLIPPPVGAEPLPPVLT